MTTTRQVPRFTQVPLSHAREKANGLARRRNLEEPGGVEVEGTSTPRPVFAHWDGWMNNTPKQTVLDEGVLDDAAVGVFMSGHCHSFALALGRCTRRMLLVLGERGSNCIFHVGVRVDDDRYVDARGVRSIDGDNCCVVAEVPASLDLLLNALWALDMGVLLLRWLPCQADDAQSFAAVMAADVEAATR